MNEKRDNIYIYLWEELNTVYIGRTINPKSRHYQHKHRESERTYQFSSEHHVEHPKMIIIENDLTIEEGVEREKYWINEYKNNSPYDVLNKTSGGEKGNSSKVFLTEEEREKKRKDWYEKHKGECREKSKIWRKLNKEYARLRDKQYREKHKDELKAKNKLYRENHKEDIKKYREEHKDEIKLLIQKYKEEHKEELKLKNKLYRENHKEDIKKYQD